MKKFVAMLLCLVLLVPMFTLVSVAEESVRYENVKISVIEILKNKNAILKELFQKLRQPKQESVIPEKVPAPETGKEDVAQVQTTISDFENRVAELVNAERAKYGLKPLTLSKVLSDGARMKSRDMHDNRYFSHTSPVYGSPFQMIRNFGLSFRTAGENIAYGQRTPQAVVNAWMNSSGHRANILNPSYTQIGVGNVASGHHWTQMFIG